MNSIISFLCFVLVVFSPIAARAQSEDILALTETLTPAQYKAAGMDKLTPREREVLNRAAKVYAIAMISLATSEARAPIASAPIAQSGGVVESRIDGEFTGWEGETIFKLMNGQIWQQASYAYTYHYAYGPKVLIYRSGGGYKMKVEGVNGEIAVRRLK